MKERLLRMLLWPRCNPGREHEIPYIIIAWQLPWIIVYAIGVLMSTVATLVATFSWHEAMHTWRTAML